MTALLTAAAWALGVLALSDVLAAADATRALAAVERLLAPARLAGRDGLAIGRRERRRVVLTGGAVPCAAGWLVGGPVAAAVCALTGPPLAVAVVGVRRRRWTAAVAADAPAAARALAAALASGSGLSRALAVAAEDGALGAPGRGLLRRAVCAIAFGARTDEALGALARSAGPGPWPALVAAILVQREAGGDLARLLEELAGDLDTTARAMREARSASAQARLTARIVAGLPLAGAALVELAAPGSFRAMAGDRLALALVLAATLLGLVALAVVQRIARVGDG